MPKKATKKTSFGADLIEGMKLVLAHMRGEIELERVVIAKKTRRRAPRTRRTSSPTQ